MESNKINARIAGLIYLVVVVTGTFTLGYVPSKLFADSPSATYNNIVSYQLLYRFGIVSGVICYGFFLFLPLALYRLLKYINLNMAKLMVILALVSVPVSFINMQNKFAVLALITDQNYLKVFTNEQLQAQVLMYLNNYDNGNLIASVFWGLWLFPFGFLVFKSGFLPKIFGVFLMLGCLGYLVNFTGQTVIPDYSKNSVSFYISLPASIGEIGICLWLLIMGAREKTISA